MRLGPMLLAAGIAWGQEAQLPDLAKMSAEDLQRGARLYTGHCAGCHGPRGDGGKGANLARPKLPRAPDDAALYRVISNGISGTEMPGSWAMIEREKWQVAAFVRSLGRVSQEMVTGDAVKGGQLYQSKGCAACHALDGKGGRMGPELSNIGVRRSAAYLKESLLNPAAEVPEGFAWVTFVDRTGAKIEGSRLNEDTFSIQLRDTRDRLRSYWKKEAKSLDVDPRKSPMPSYEKTLTQPEIGDLVAYLASLGGGK